MTDCNCNCECNCNCNGVSNSNSNANCNMLLMQIYQACFAMDDVILYLDTHPCDQDALNYYHYVADMCEQAVNAYEEYCGPLMSNHVMDENYWTWVNDPWPWEGVCG
ncbi:spore coat protein CotJB [Clostridium boliviensis]|uniref:Spore coat protein CotJB n=1 Tax=Clostridium boliviensis TaxID=318465 RepID=A0ABU4GMG2_9CLOT|nr:spore coat protein CotJB [Clostridium boliviensis]MDW2798806.1 spore coat protein CotJB [Clostridium boliviensis]